MTVTERLVRAQNHLIAAAQELQDAGYPNETEALRRLVTTVASHRSNAEAKRKNGGDVSVTDQGAEARKGGGS